MNSFNKTHYLSKTGLLFLLTVLALGALNCSSSKVDDNSTPEMLAKTFLHILKSNDQELFKKHLATTEHRFKFNDRPNALWKKVRTEEEHRQELKDGYNSILQNTLAKIRNEFSQLGLNDWSNVDFHNYSYQMRNTNDYTMSGQLIFVTEDMAGEMERVEFIKTSDGWKIYSVPKVDNYVSKAWLGQ